MLSAMFSLPNLSLPTYEKVANRLPGFLQRYDNRSFRLKNGTTIYLRQICSVDALLVSEIYAEMSEDSLFRRFNAYISPSLRGKLAEQTAVQAEQSGFGLLAYVLDDNRSSGIRPLGIAYYVFQAGDVPELAISIVDSFQKLGLGKILLAELFRHAKKAGRTFLQAYVLPMNVGMRLLIQQAGKPFFYGEDGAYDTYKIVL